MPPTRRESRSLLAPTALTLMLLVSAGCVGGPGTPDVAAPTTAASGAVAPPVLDAAGNALARFGIDGPMAMTLWSNGTYDVREHFFPGNFAPTVLGLAPPPGIRVLDITEHVPRGVPVQIVAEVNAQVAGDGDVDLWIDAPFDEVWSGTWDTPTGGYSKIEMSIVHESDDAVSVGLVYDEIDSSTSFDYSLRVDILSDPERVLDAVGFALDVPTESATVLVNLEEAGDDPTLLAWSPSERFLGRFPLKAGTTEIRLEDSGQHLMLLAQGSGVATLAIKGLSEPPTLSAARQEVVDFMAESPTSPVKWSFDADREPIQAGFFAASPTVGGDFTGSLASPAAKLIEAQFTGGPWVRPLMGFGTAEWTRMGGEGLVKGAYDMEVAFAQATGPDPIRYGHWFVFIGPA